MLIWVVKVSPIFITSHTSSKFNVTDRQYDLLKLKGVRQLHEVYVNNVDEAIAAEEAGIDMICTAYDMPHHGIFGKLEDVKRIREAAPNTHLMSAAPEKSYATADEAVRAAYKLLSIGCDSFYTNNSSKIIDHSLKISHFSFLIKKSLHR